MRLESLKKSQSNGQLQNCLVSILPLISPSTKWTNIPSWLAFPWVFWLKSASCEKISQLHCTLHPLLFLSTSLLSFQSWAYEFLHNLTDQVHWVGNKSPVAQAKSRAQKYCMSSNNIQVLGSQPPLLLTSGQRECNRQWNLNAFTSSYH